MSTRHLPNCTCAAHAKIEAYCPCHNQLFTTHGALSSHLRSTKKKRIKKSVILPDGQEFLEAVALSKEHVHEYNLSILRQFSAALHPCNDRSRRFSRRHRETLRQAVESPDPFTLMRHSLDLTAQTTATVLRMAQAADGTPAAALALLVSYGISYMSREMRVSKTAPPVIDPSTREVMKYTTPAQDMAGVQPTEHIVVFDRSNTQNEHKPRRFGAPKTGSEEV